jgi:Flp pilus assembly protein TadG
MTWNKGHRTRRGNAVLEAALVLPILLLLAFGTVEFGHFFYVKHNLQGAAREGVRAAIIGSATNADVTRSVADAMALYGLANSGYSVTTSPGNISTAGEGDNVSVTVQCTWGEVGMRPLALIGANKLVKAVAVMRKEG